MPQTKKNCWSIAICVTNSYFINKGYFRSGFDEPEKLLAEYGWKATAIQPGDESAHFERYTNKLPPREVPDIERVFLIKAHKKA